MTNHLRLLQVGLCVLIVSGLASCRLVMDIPDGPPAPAECGNGAQEGAEDCDGSDLDGRTCADVGFLAGSLSCNADCTFNTTMCFTGDDCGDGVVQAGGLEECDGENLDGATCASLGFGGGTLVCTDDCEFDTSACEAPVDCGNGVIDDIEECDGELLAGDSPPTCLTLGYMGGGPLNCNANCTLDESGCISICGNEVIEPDETCDPGSRQHPGCSTDCQVNPGWECTGAPSVCTSTCGDDIITAVEDCEGSDLNGQNCTTWGMGYGPLSCGADCLFDTSACVQVVDVAAGDRHTCVTMSTGAAYCWGDGDDGQLGAGNYAETNLPTRVISTESWLRITAAGNHSCAVAAPNGDLRQHIWCWGLNDNGQLGTGVPSQTNLPAAVSEPWTSTAELIVSAHGRFTCAAVLGGSAFCWGSNADGQLGTGNYTSYQTPRQVQDINNLSDLVTGLNHACALAGEDLYCWGGNGYGQLGIGFTGSPVTRPAMISIASGAQKITAGTYFTCAVSYSGHPHCWGANAYGQLGTGNTTQQASPTLVLGLTDVADIAAGSLHACALMLDGTVRCWGSNASGQLGNGTTTDSTSPITVSMITNAIAISAGGAHTCALLSDGTVACWGFNFSGQLGSGSNVDSVFPVLVQF